MTVGLTSAELATLDADFAVSTLTVAELIGGLRAAPDDLESRRRRNHLNWVEARINVLPFDPRCAEAYGRIYAAVRRIGRKPRGAIAVDLMIAATALAHDLPIYTLNAKDLRGLEGLVEIVDLGT